MRQLVTLAVCGSLLALGGCGVRGVEGDYQGSMHGTMTYLGLLSVAVAGDVGFEIVPASDDWFDAAGDLVVKNGNNTYEATLSGRYQSGDLNMTFVAKDGNSTGTMQGEWKVGGCWKNGTWTVSGTGASGSGTWEACR